MIVSLILFFIIFGVLVTTHELGHFLIAKANNIKVNEFFVGMGPTLWKKQKGETLYSIKLLPIGGACVLKEKTGLMLTKKNLMRELFQMQMCGPELQCFLQVPSLTL